MSAIKLQIKGWTFVWFEGSPYVEAFRKDDPQWAPREVFLAGDIKYTEHQLKELVKSLDYNTNERG